MRRPVILRFCGVDWVEDKREVPATYSHAMSIDGSKQHDLDLCEKHTAMLVALDVEFLERYGTLSALPSLDRVEEPVKGRLRGPVKDEKIPCEVPGCNFGPDGGPFIAKNRSGLAAHAGSKHEGKYRGIVATNVNGSHRIASTTPGTRATYKVICPICKQPASKTVRGVPQHMALMHPDVPTAERYRLAQAMR